MTALEVREGNRLLAYQGPGLSEPVRYGELLRAGDARLVALIAAREAGMLSEGEYYAEVESLCSGDCSGLHSRRMH